MYNFKEFEKKWSEYWATNKVFETDVWDFSKPKYYVLVMFPYPSGQGLHVGHAEVYTATDIMARFKKMQGFNVLHPMGFDSFGLPAEQYAIQTGNHPDIFTQKNIQVFKEQLKNLGFSFDWTKEISTCDPSYYKWTQWIFKQLYNDGYAKLSEIPVNWCEELGTVLANDEIIDGKSERGGFPVVKKFMKQWVIDFTKYLDKLIEGLDTIDWPNSTKEIQRNWIGRSEGAKVNFAVSGTKFNFEIFTTRIDTIFGVTYCVLSPEHDLVLKITSKDKIEEVKKYIHECSLKSELERTSLNKDKNGVFTGAYAINPANNKKIPIYISSYVLNSYGTGAIMAVPAHDQRDYDFAKKYNIEIIPVLEGGDIQKEAFLDDGKHINSEYLNGLNKEEAIKTALKKLGEKGKAEKSINYKIRDWIFARQRYWGEPIPIVFLEDGSTYVLKDSELPLTLPTLSNYKPQKNNASPLARATDWVNVKIDGKNGVRETNTMPGSAGSSWYFLRYIDPQNNNEIANEKLLKHWMPVDLYIGGDEHAVGHLIYSRFWNNYLYDKGVSPCKEPFAKLVHQGMVLGENNEKMSKSKGNVINPNDIINLYGADVLRVYEMFMGPLEATKPWNTKNIAGAKNFLEKVWKLYHSNIIKNEENENLDKIYNFTVKKVTEDYEALRFNTAISQMMIFLNAVTKEKVFPKKYAEGYIKLLNPIAPYITEEIWQKVLGKNQTIANEKWPTYSENVLEEDNFNLVVQINGKLRAVISISKNLSKEEIKETVLNDSKIKSFIQDKKIAKIIIIPNKVINIVLN